jgi:hypothetical protein
MIFASAQKRLQTTFGMEMVALPSRDKVTQKEKRGWQILSAYCIAANDLQLPKKQRTTPKL